MDQIAARLETFFGEIRILVPALAALFGFQLVVAFQESFASLPGIVRIVNFVGVCSTLAAIILLMAPTSEDRLVHGLHRNAAFLARTQRFVGAAFVFIPIGLAASLFVQAVRTFGQHSWTWAAPAVVVVVAVTTWWAVPVLRR